jgi:hypothetical protein
MCFLLLFSFVEFVALAVGPFAVALAVALQIVDTVVPFDSALLENSSDLPDMHSAYMDSSYKT